MILEEKKSYKEDRWTHILCEVGWNTISSSVEIISTMIESEHVLWKTIEQSVQESTGVTRLINPGVLQNYGVLYTFTRSPLPW